jgi:hypothetical protein
MTAAWRPLPELLLDEPIESDTLPDEAEPALDAEEAVLAAAWAGMAQVAAHTASSAARVYREIVMERLSSGKQSVHRTRVGRR